MEVLKKEFGIYATNCYIVRGDFGDLIIDPGVDSAAWVKENAKNPLAILNTHGHFDHIWCNAELKKALNVPIICPKQDAFMLKSDCFNLGLSPQMADVLVEENEIIIINKNGEITRNVNLSADLNADSVDSNPDSSDADSGVRVEYMFFPGHTPGCSMIKIEDSIFSGDFIFYRSIGRSDFPYSSTDDMKKSLQRFKTLAFNATLYPGHGENTSIKEEQARVDFWITRM